MCEQHAKLEQAQKPYDHISCPDASPQLLARHLMRKADLSQDGEISENEIATMLGQVHPIRVRVGVRVRNEIATMLGQVHPRTPTPAPVGVDPAI